MSSPDAPSPPDIPLTRAEKEKLLQQMYSLPHWIAVIRLFAYRTVSMSDARQAIKPIAEEFGKEPVADACEVLVEIVPGKEPFARLKSHIRRMAFQILGPEEAPIPTAPIAPPEPPTKTEPVHAPERKPRRTRRKSPVASTVEGQASSSGPPLIDQYRAAKEKHPDMLLMFRIGNFYELFAEDAEAAHTLLGLTLTTRDGTPMAGFPHHQLETYLHKLLKAGQRVAVCDQVDESPDRALIKREVTRVVTPDSTVDTGRSEEERQSNKSAPRPETRAIKQPRHHVLKQYQAWMAENGLAFIAVDDVKRTTPAVAPHVASLDFIVLRGNEKLLVAVRPHLQTKHLNAFAELQELFGPEYRPVRVWPVNGVDGWLWTEHPISPAKRG